MPSGSTSGAQCRFVGPPLFLAILLLWLVPTGTSLGLDETGNDWVIKLGLRESFVRSRLWAGTSWLSNALMIGARWIGGDHEAVLRAPSLAAALATVVTLYFLGRRLVGPAAAALACVVFVCLRDVVYVASAMRPYALAVFFTTAAMLSLVKWFDAGRTRDGVMYVLLAASTLYAHVFFATTLLVHASYFLLRRSQQSRLPVGIQPMLAAWFGIGVLAVPQLLNLRTLLVRPVSSLYLGRPGISELLVSVAPPVLIGSVVVAILISVVAGHRPMRSFQVPDWGALPRFGTVRAGLVCRTLLLGQRPCHRTSSRNVDRRVSLGACAPHNHRVYRDLCRTGVRSAGTLHAGLA
jgi:hypothetical protein